MEIQEKEKQEKEKEMLKQAEKDVRCRERIRKYGAIGRWFQTICLMNIPIVGFWYMVVLAVRKKTPPQKKSFAVAYILYRILVMLLAFTILYVLYRIGLDFADSLLQYAGAV